MYILVTFLITFKASMFYNDLSTVKLSFVMEDNVESCLIVFWHLF